MNTDGHGFLAAKGHRGREGRKGPKRRICVRWRRAVSWPDLIMRAFAREREARRVVRPMEYETVLAHVFRCACCGKIRPEEERREPRSEVCLSCVREAGFLNG